DQRKVTVIAGDEDIPGPVTLTDPQVQDRRDRLVEAPARPEVGNPEPEVVDRRPALRAPRPVDGLDAVAVRIEKEAAVVVGRVLRPRAGLAVTRVPGPHPTPPEGVDVFRRASREGDVEVPCHRMLGVGLYHSEVLPLVE